MQLGVLFGGAGILSGSSLLRVGIMAASAVGMYLFGGGKDKGEASRLDDLKVSCSSYGRGIAIVYGTMRVSGNMIWATDFEETLHYLGPKGKEKSGKKGEKKGTPYYEYHANFAMLLCEGPVEELLRVWADSNLIYDKHNPKNKDLVEIGFSRGDGGGGKSGFGASKKKGGQGGDSGRFQFRFYPGTEEQLQDPFMVKKQGVDLVPAYRGECYLFFEHFKLEDFGNRIPTITAEVTVKKKVETTYNVLENLDTKHFDLNNFKAEVDPERYKLYSQEFDRTGTSSGIKTIRIYDLATNREVRRVTYDEIEAINSLPYWDGFGIAAWIGLSGNGDLVFRLGGGNSAPIAFVDPNTFVSKGFFGHGTGFWANRLSNTDTTIVSAQKATPTGYIQPLVNEDGSAELVPTRATLIQSFGNWFYVFGQQNEPLSYFKLPGWFDTSTTSVLTIPGGLWGGTFYATSGPASGGLCTLYRISWGITTITTDGVTTADLTNATTAQMKKVRELTGKPGDALGFDNLQYVVGAEVVGWLEYRSNTFVVVGPSSSYHLAGLRAACVDPFDSHQKIKFEFDVSANASDRPDSDIAALPLNTSSGFKWLKGSTVWSVNFVTQEVNSYSIGNQLISSTDNHQVYWPQRGAIVKFITSPEDGVRHWAMAFLDRNTQTPVDVEFICRDLAERVGIPDEKIDTQRLNEDEITGYIIENPTSARNVVEDLSRIFMFDVIESDYMLKFISRGQDSIVTVPQIDLAAIDEETLDTYKETRTQEIDLPQTVVVSYINPDKDYETNSQSYRRPRSPFAVMQSRDKLELNESMAMDNDFAKQTAHKVCMSLWAERITYDFMLPWKYMVYDPTDVMTFQFSSGLTVTTRMLKMDLGADYTIDATGVVQTPASYTSNATAGLDGGVITSPKPFPPVSRPFVADVPYLSDDDDVGNAQFSYYWGAEALSSGFQGAVAEYRLPGTDWKYLGLPPEELVWGYVIGAVPPPPNGPYATDDKTEIKLAPGHDFLDTDGSYLYSWESIPDSNWPSNENQIIIGDEIIYFKNASIDANGIVTISTLIRGARGTENAAYNHAANEIFAIQTTGLQQAKAGFSTLSLQYAFRTFSGYSMMPPYKVERTMTAASHKPWGLNRFQRSVVFGTDIRISWERRTRLGGEMKNGTGSVPLNEETEQYEIYILDAPYDPDFFDPDNPATYVRKFQVTGSSRHVDYTAAMLTADGKTLNDVIHVVGFQLSSAIGRGFPGYDTLYKSILIEV